MNEVWGGTVVLQAPRYAKALCSSPLQTNPQWNWSLGILSKEVLRSPSKIWSRRAGRTPVLYVNHCSRIISLSISSVCFLVHIPVLLVHEKFYNWNYSCLSPISPYLVQVIVEMNYYLLIACKYSLSTKMPYFWGKTCISIVNIV